MSIAGLLQAAAALRAGLLALGAWQDARLQVKYTDIDYEVVTDGAAFLAAGQSPYARSTYRYTPLLAAALLPNVTVHKAWGKLLFCGADLLAAWLFAVLLRRRRASLALQRWGLALWLFSPFTATISTRGSGEALVTCMLLGLLLALEAGRLVPAALLYGLAVHWRLYPIIYALPLLRHFALQRQHAAGAAGAAGLRRSTRQAVAASTAGARPGPLRHVLHAAAVAVSSLVSPAGAVFGALSGGLFIGLAAAFYRLWGDQFLHETYLYHASRVDPRHNFSAYFYPAYLASSGGPQAARWDVGWAFSGAQLVLQAAVGWLCASDLPFCFLLLTMLFVAFNKVVTAQYFVWYLSFLPLVLPDLAASTNKCRLVAATSALAAAMGHWLLWAYLLEFQGWRCYLAVWGAGLVFFAAHIWLICELLLAWRQKHAAAAATRTKGKLSGLGPPTLGRLH